VDEVRDETRDEDEGMALVARTGDRAVRNALFLRHAGLVKRLTRPAKGMLARISARRWSGILAIEPQDVEQQAFLVFCRLLDEWDPDRERFTDSLTRRMPGHLLHYVRDSLSYTRRERSFDPFDAEEAAATSPRHSPIEERETALSLESYTGELPPGLLQTVMLRYYADLSCNQIAAISHRHRRTVNRNLNTALALMRERMEEEWEGCG
jgi:RNA polymerase sigma factor (sigma-70 family)